MSIPWPKEIRDIIARYHPFMLDNNHILEDNYKNMLVEELIRVYKGLSNDDQAQFLVPASGAFLKDEALCVEFPVNAFMLSGTTSYDKAAISINYNFPDNNGFVPGTDYPSKIEKDKEYDRVGSPYGYFLSPIKADNTPESFFSRAIPYYIPDENDVTSSPAYHRYIAVAEFKENNGNYPLEGIIAQAFRKNPDDGGGKQLVFTQLVKKILFDEITGEGVLKDVTK